MTTSNFIATARSLPYTPVPSAKSFIQIWNPGDVTAYLKRITIHHLYSATDADAVEWDLRKSNAFIGTTNGVGTNKDFSGADGVVQFNYGATYLNDLDQVTDAVIYHGSAPRAKHPVDQDFADPIIMPPETGLLIVLLHSPRTLIVSAQYSEEEESE